ASSHGDALPAVSRFLRTTPTLSALRRSPGVPRFPPRVGRGLPLYVAADALGTALRRLADRARTLLCPQASVHGWAAGCPGRVCREGLGDLGRAHPGSGTASSKRLRGRHVDRSRPTGRVALRGCRWGLERGSLHPARPLEWRSVHSDRFVWST